jgi:hypothetical protein
MRLPNLRPEPVVVTVRATDTKLDVPYTLSAGAIFDLDGNDVALDTTAVKALCGVPDACLQHPAGLDPRQRRLAASRRMEL